MLNKVTILIQTYGKNTKGLDLSLRALETYVPGFRGYRDVVHNVCKKCLLPLGAGPKCPCGGR